MTLCLTCFPSDSTSVIWYGEVSCQDSNLKVWKGPLLRMFTKWSRWLRSGTRTIVRDNWFCILLVNLMSSDNNCPLLVPVVQIFAFLYLFCTECTTLYALLDKLPWPMDPRGDAAVTHYRWQGEATLSKALPLYRGQKLKKNIPKSMWSWFIFNTNLCASWCYKILILIGHHILLCQSHFPFAYLDAHIPANLDTGQQI